MSARASILPVFVPHRGCPHQCVFCDQNRISGEKERVDAQRVRELMKAAAAPGEEGCERQLAFYGGSFTAIDRHEQQALLDAAREGIERGWISSVRLSTRPDAIDGATLRRLKAAGVAVIELGAQSMDDEVLRLSGRGHGAQDVRNAARAVKTAGFSLVLQMMTGLPGDSEEKSLATARELIALEPDGVRIYPTVIVKGTALEKLWRSGAYREHSVEDAVRVCARLLPLFEKAGVPVIRLGLNPTEELSGGAAVAGAYHPALGELVRARLWRNRAEALLQGVPGNSRATLCVPSRRLSQMLGQRRENVRWLGERFSLASLSVRGTADDGDALRLETDAADDE